VLRVCVDELVWLRIGVLREDQEMRLDVAKRIQEMGRSRAHRRGRISLGRPADWRSSGEKFRSPCCGSSGEAKGERERTPGAIYRQGLDGHYCEKLPGGLTPAISRRERE
jgi:hypothetical protein